MEQRELMEPRQVVDEVVDAHVESEVACLEVCPTQVDGLVRCHRVGGWMVMCQWVGVRKVTGRPTTPSSCKACANGGAGYGADLPKSGRPT